MCAMRGRPVPQAGGRGPLSPLCDRSRYDSADRALQHSGSPPARLLRRTEMYDSAASCDQPLGSVPVYAGAW